MDLTKLLYFTEEAQDKVVDTLTGSFSLGASARIQQNLSHNFGEPMFSESSFSVDNTSFLPCPLPMRIGAGNVEVAVAVSSSQVKIYAWNNTTSTQTIYYRVQLIWPRI